MQQRAHVPAALLLLAPALGAQSTIRVSVDSAGAQALDVSWGAATSTAGRFTAFLSAAQNLVPGDAGGFDVFRHDRATGQTACASVTPGGVPGGGTFTAIDRVAITPDGRYVAFFYSDADLVVGDANALPDVFVRDMTAGVTTIASRASGGAQADAVSWSPALSDDGRYVAFVSDATNLVAGVNRGVFVRDRTAGTTVCASVDSSGAPGNGSTNDLRALDISGNGRYVAFQSPATNLVAGDTNAAEDVFVHDLATGLTERVSTDSGGGQSNGAARHPAISLDGRWVAFETNAWLTPDDTDGFQDVYVKDRSNGATIRVSRTDGDFAPSGSSYSPSISNDGRWVAFSTMSANFDPGDNGQRDVFVRDLATGLTHKASPSASGGNVDAPCTYPGISPDGGWVAFQATATNLVAGDTNGDEDVFVRNRGALPAWTSWCFGDGTSTPCPCGNDVPYGDRQGCASSLGYGAKLVAEGVADSSADTFTLVGMNMPNGTALYFQGTAPANGTLGIAFGDGLLCVLGTVVRLGQKINVNGESRYPETGDQPISVQGQVPQGAIRHYQIWYRNAAAFCTANTYNLSNAITIQWGCSICP